jgi:hypothetical protein
MWNEDDASQGLGMEIVQIKGWRLTMTFCRIW